jgi:hypothetical protein
MLWRCATVGLLAAGLCAGSSCSKEQKQEEPARQEPSTMVPSGDPHGTAGAAAVNPHGTAGAAAVNPHGATPMPAAPAAGQTTADGKRILGAIAVAVPEGWKEESVTSSMRRGQWKIDAEGGQAELVVYYFGQAGAGSVEKNLERWYGQFEQPDGRPSKEVAQTAEKTIGDMKVTRVEVGGRYVAEVRPGAGERHDVANARMLAAIVEAPDGAYYFKMVGPDATVKAAAANFDKMLESMARAQ